MSDNTTEEDLFEDDNKSLKLSKEGEKELVRVVDLMQDLFDANRDLLDLIPYRTKHGIRSRQITTLIIMAMKIANDEEYLKPDEE